MIKFFDIDSNIKFNKINSLFKKIINEVEISDKNILRYSFKGDNNYILYALRNWSEDVLKVNSNIKTDNNEESIYNIFMHERELRELNDCVIDYQNYIDNQIIKNNINFEMYKLSSHLNYYPYNNIFKIPNDTYYSRMPYHIDSSEYTIVHQNQKGLKIKNHPRIISNENKIIFFDSKLEHRIELYHKERFSISTFIFKNENINTGM